MPAAELVPVDNVAALDTLLPADRDQAVTQMLEQAHSWLVHAVEFTAPVQDIADFKAFIQTVADASKRTKVAKEIQVDAEVMVRRSERALGVAIREGQEAGEIETTQEGNARGALVRDIKAGRVDLPADSSEVPKPKPTDFAKESELSGNQSGIYQMADDVTDEQFEEAITEAKEERNVSRANVVRKIKDGGVSPKTARDDPARLQTICDMAEEGHNSQQISNELGVSTEYIRQLARDYDIDIPADKLTGRTRRIDSTRVVSHTVLGVSAVTSGLDLVDFSELDGEQLQEWVNSLSESLRTLHKFADQLKKELTTRG